MPNGTGLLGEFSSIHSAVAVRKPGSTHIYYIFTADANHLIPNTDGGGTNGYNYSVLDMTLDNGLGDLTTTKNILMYSPSTEKLAVTTHANGTDNGRNMFDRWDGTYKSHRGSTTNFVWVAEAVTFDGRNILRKGNIVLIR